MIDCFLHEGKLLDKAMKSDYIDSALALLLFVGVTGSGKSLFKRYVLGLPVPEFSPSTPLADAFVRSMSICQVAVDGGFKWIVVSPQAMLNMVAKRVKEEKVPSYDLPLAPKPHSFEQQKDAKFEDALEKIDIDSQLLQKISNPSMDKTPKLMDIDFIYMLDSGGQPPFREMLPHLVQQASATVLFQKLNEKLDFKPTIKYREEGKSDKGYTSQLTNEQILYQYIQGVQSHRSAVFVVGTHRGRERECDENIEIKNEKLLAAFRPVLKKEQLQLYTVGNPDELIFPLDSVSRETQDETVVDSFRKRVIEKCM